MDNLIRKLRHSDTKLASKTSDNLCLASGIEVEHFVSYIHTQNTPNLYLSLR